MKTKVILGLSVCCLMFSLGGLVMTNLSQAQIKPKQMPGGLFIDEDWDYWSDPNVLCPKQLSDYVGIGTSNPN